MGLDMYLYKRHYVKNWDHMKPEELHSVEIKKGDKIREDIKKDRICNIVEEVAYWRKANQIHDWFIRNCGNGDQDERQIYVNFDNLKGLLETVNKVIDGSKLVEGKIRNGQTYKDGKLEDNMVYGKYIEDPSLAKELLPTVEGFFFGSQDYDEWYYQDLIYTRNMLTDLIAEPEAECADYEYQASW